MARELVAHTQHTVSGVVGRCHGAPTQVQHHRTLTSGKSQLFPIRNKSIWFS